MKSMLFKKQLICFILLFTSLLASAQNKRNILVFSKTAGFRHTSIEAGQRAIDKMAKEKGFDVTFTENARLFADFHLKKYNAVVFLNTTGDILNADEQNAFERYIQAGGGYVGIHAATDTEYDWPWYGKLAGAWFLDHPIAPSNVQKGKFTVVNHNHWSTQGMPQEFERADEFYSFKNISSNIKVVLKIDESSYTGGKNGDNHPMSWYQEFDGGRSFYTAMGHTDECFVEPLFLNHLWAGIKYSSGGETPNVLDYTKARPEDNRFSKVVLQEKLDEPMELTILDNDRILFIQRKGEIKLYNNKTNILKTIAKLPVNIMYKSKDGKESMGEDGLLGLNKDPHFQVNQWIYLYYSSPKGSYNQLSRFTMKGDEIILNSEKELLKVETQREECCHTGGSIDWDKAGNLYLSTGDNTNPHGSNGFSPVDERIGRENWDAQRTSANSNDLRGKILRITPQPDGTYTIPEGNLFTKGSNQTRPEIYTMGHRNPFRISIDSKTGILYWGDVGPDAANSDSTRGPAGHDEVGQAKKAGNFGWPHFVGDNKAYTKYNFEKNISLEKWDANTPLNNSPNNTGIKVLPQAEKAFIWYPYGESKEFPLVGAGGRNAMAGPVFHLSNFKVGARIFPKYYEDKLFTYDWMRGWIMVVTLDSNGNYQSMERFMPTYKFSNPMDMAFAENGDLYMLEYGSGWFTANDDARLVRIEYNGGNRKPHIQIETAQSGGGVPFKLKLSSKGTFDADGDPLKYSWKIVSKNGFNFKSNEKNPDLILTKVGIYKVSLTVNDGKGGISSQSIEVTAGNEPPSLTLDIAKANKTFFVANKAFDYKIQVKDKEDGELGSGINTDNVSVNIDYLAEGYDKNIIAMGHRSADASIAYLKGKKLIESNDCMACHSKDKKSIGPSYRSIATKYKDDNSALEKLTKKVIVGGSGVWGETAMSGHPQLSTAEAAEMVKYILSITNEKTKQETLPVVGSFMAKVPTSDKNKGVYIVRASYEDRGAKGIPSFKAEQSFVLRNSIIDPHSFDDYVDMSKMAYGGRNLVIAARQNAHLLLKQIDLTSISALDLIISVPQGMLNSVGGLAELHLDKPTGLLLGVTKVAEPSSKPSKLNMPIQLPLNFDGKLHDMYIVFKNPKGENGTIMIVTSVEVKFKNE